MTQKFFCGITFFGSLILRFIESIWRIRDDGRKFENYPITLKICIAKFFASLITNLTFDFRNLG